MVTAEQMDQKDMEMKEVIGRLWPVQAKKLSDLLVPPRDGMELIQQFHCKKKSSK